MPEVVVTQAKKLKGALAESASEDQVNEDENKLQPPDKGMRIWNLLPVKKLLLLLLLTKNDSFMPLKYVL